MPRDLEGVRVLLVGDWPPPLGGVSVHVRALRDAARKAGASPTVVDIGHGQNEADGVVPSGHEWQFIERLVHHLRNSDLVHLHTSGANPKSWLLASCVGLAGRATSTRALVTFHSGHGPRYLRTASRALTARMALAPYARVICVNEEISRTLTRIGAAEHRHVVAPAFGLEGIAPSSLPVALAGSLADHTPLISCMLAPGRDYGAADLFRAFARLQTEFPRAVLVVYGNGTDSAETGRLAEDAHASHVRRLGQLERSQALALMAASDLFVRPTLVDGDAVSVREALALGRRVVATRVGTRPEGVTLCAPADPADLARAMGLALSRPAPAPGVIDDGIETVLRLYAHLAHAEAPESSAA